MEKVPQRGWLVPWASWALPPCWEACLRGSLSPAFPSAPQSHFCPPGMGIRIERKRQELK